jgi:vacuolar-type H+-ATPase subunit C/Vma6
MIPVPIIEYLNVRIRHFHSRLFRRDTYEDLLAGDNLGALTTFLLDNPDYSADIGASVGDLPEREGLEQGITRHFGRCISDVLGMAGEEQRLLFQSALFSFDLRNIRTIVLARAREISPQKATDLFIPGGALPESALHGLLRADNRETIAFLLAHAPAHGMKMAEEILKTDQNDKPLADIMNGIEIRAYRGMLAALDETDHNGKVLRDVLRSEIDLKNIARALKIAVQDEKQGISENETFIPGGFVAFQTLNDIGDSKDMDEALEKVETTPYHTAVEKGILYYAETGFIHEMERFFEEVFIRKALSYRRFDPFGIGVFVGYLWGKYAEMTNLRAIVNGISFRLGPAQIRSELLYV